MSTICNPYQNLSGGQWLRGNLHAHTDRTDGDRPMQEVVDDYARRGYDFLMISDHDLLTAGEDHAATDAKGMILIPGNEVTADGPHMLHVGADRMVEPDPQRQVVLNNIAAGAGFAIANHPNWQAEFNHCPIEKLLEWTGLTGLEIYNGVIGRFQGSPYATNKWDMLLTRGRRLWGFANDDSHAAAGDVALGWNVAYVTDPSPRGVVEALSQGRFYASTGVEINAIEVDSLKIRIETENAARIVALTNHGKRLASADDRSIEVQVPDDATYVRFECWGTGEQFAWTQPFFVEASSKNAM